MDGLQSTKVEKRKKPISRVWLLQTIYFLSKDLRKRLYNKAKIECYRLQLCFQNCVNFSRLLKSTIITLLEKKIYAKKWGRRRDVFFIDFLGVFLMKNNTSSEWPYDSL